MNYAEFFAKYIPNFQYYLVPICEYENEELLEKADEISLIMLINKLQTEEDITEFKKILPEQWEKVLKETPKNLLDKIANVLLAFLLKVNVPVPEAEELVGRVREKKMAELFENMDKIDVQEMRRKTEIQRQLAEEERQRAEEERQRAEEERQRAEEQRQRAEEQRQRAENAEQLVENGIRLFIENCQEFSLTKKDILSRLVEKFELSEELAGSKIAKYWKE